MPMKVNVGASRKIADERYCSRGASVNLEIELDSGLVTDASKLQERIRQLFNLVHQSLTEELDLRRDAPAQTSLDATPAGGPKVSGKPIGVARPATQAQVKAVFAIAKQQDIDLLDLLRERYSVERPQDLLLKQASELIDALKSNTAAKAA